MSGHLEAPAEAKRPPLGKTAMVARLALIGVILAAALGTVAYLGGWLTPNVLTPARRWFRGGQWSSLRLPA